jgi:hypothetical protein
MVRILHPLPDFGSRLARVPEILAGWSKRPAQGVAVLVLAQAVSVGQQIEDRDDEGEVHLEAAHRRCPACWRW